MTCVPCAAAMRCGCDSADCNVCHPPLVDVDHATAAKVRGALEVAFRQVRARGHDVGIADVMAALAPSIAIHYRVVTELNELRARMDKMRVFVHDVATTSMHSLSNANMALYVLKRIVVDALDLESR
jgi:hypothetical protein